MKPGAWERGDERVVRPEAAKGVLAIFLRALRPALRDASPGAPAAVRDVHLEAIAFAQGFGSSLNPHYHYHVLALDGVVSVAVEHGAWFHEATGLEAPEAKALARSVQLRVLRWFTRRWLRDPATVGNMRTWQTKSPTCTEVQVGLGYFG